MTTERLLGEMVFDPEHLQEYIAVREERLPDGKVTGVLVEAGLDPDEVHAALKSDQNQNQGASYYLYKPMNEPNVREGWAIEGNDESRTEVF